MSRNWTPEDDAIIREHATSGWSYTAAAAQLGVTRNMIIGRARRIGAKSVWKNENEWTPEEDARLIALARSELSAREIAKELGRTKFAVSSRLQTLGIKLSEFRSGSKRKSKPLPKPQPEPGARNITLLQLTNHTCKWPVSGEGADTRFCGHESETWSSYCARHMLDSVHPDYRAKLARRRAA